MNDPRDPNRPVDEPSELADSLDAGLATGLGTPLPSGVVRNDHVGW
jgi:hypothetical protein